MLLFCIIFFRFSVCFSNEECADDLVCLPTSNGIGSNECVNPCTEDLCLPEYGPNFICVVIFHVPQCIPREPIYGGINTEHLRTCRI